ncbi:MAG TPA: hypothetical protein DET40_20890 [Lentisphaeria bacterium]|nr:MAG: hypothetical protein A2X45_15510 [Lentisphaerae bacterium GWF2_50_93]HCE46010.1 hypothetical protein [Lentisphaeria bacterium]
MTFVFFCIIAAVIPLLDDGRNLENPAVDGDIVFPEGIEIGTMSEIGLSSKEKIFFSKFPGKAAKFSDGTRTMILRTVNTPTRLLHPAMECFRGMGYSTSGNGIQLDSRKRMWGVFSASHPDGGAYRVREIVFDSEGKSWSDISAWYWNAEFSLSTGPWTSVLTVEKVE